MLVGQINNVVAVLQYYVVIDSTVEGVALTTIFRHKCLC